jgi:hypothetical protein
MPPLGRRNQFHQLSSFERGRIIGLRAAGFFCHLLYDVIDVGQKI